MKYTILGVLQAIILFAYFCGGYYSAMKVAENKPKQCLYKPIKTLK